MGYLTPVLIRNDSLCSIKKNKDEAIEELIKASSSNKTMSHCVGCCANAMESPGTRHADINRVLVVHGNSWVDLSDNKWELERNDKVFIDYLRACVEIAERDVKLLKKKLKELEDK